jgi:hypothetical protein
VVSTEGTVFYAMSCQAFNFLLRVDSEEYLVFPQRYPRILCALRRHFAPFAYHIPNFLL